MYRRNVSDKGLFIVDCALCSVNAVCGALFCQCVATQFFYNFVPLVTSC